MDYGIEYENWAANPLLDAESARELAAIRDDEKEKEYRFGGELEFGTAGMRGLCGCGTNMMNVYTVRRATQGLAEYLLENVPGASTRGVVVSFDTRRFSRTFARETAGVLANNGIRVRLFPEPHPVPMLSFAVRRLRAAAGVMITASHNPKEYNGYKVYGADGAQLSPEEADKVVEKIRRIKDVFSVKAEEFGASKAVFSGPWVSSVPKSVDRKYYRTVLRLSLAGPAVRKFGKKFAIVYTPVHGSGFVPVTTVLKKAGIRVSVVGEQAAPDENFSTVKVPNPEFGETLSMGIALAEKIGADAVFGTDPDCDRLGVAVKNGEGKFVALSGNQIGILLLDYILSRKKEAGTLPKNGFVVKSFVSTGMAKAIAEDFGVELVETPVGFKFIGEKIEEAERSGDKTFLFGFEESCGYLAGTHCRDKDGVVASLLFAEMACFYAGRKQTVWDRLVGIYDKYGYVLDRNESIAFDGLDAMAKMNAAVDALKGKEVRKLGIYAVSAIRDYSAGVRVTADGETEELRVPPCNCLYYEIENGSFVCVRPSGTEPKLKIYYSVKARDAALAEKMFAELRGAFGGLLGL